MLYFHQSSYNCSYFLKYRYIFDVLLIFLLLIEEIRIQIAQKTICTIYKIVTISNISEPTDSTSISVNK
jgi:hypothetical protein